MDIHIRAELNSFATRSFRDIADQDYIAARLSYRYDLVPQFHWQSLQALEKYFKAIFLYNKIEAKGLNHNIEKALKFTTKLPFEMLLCDSTLEFIEHLGKFGKFRYLESSYYIFGPKLVQLDKAVWEIRRYCHVINYTHELQNGIRKNMLDLELEKISLSENKPPHQFKINGGLLEKIVQTVDHPSRSALVWQNEFFGKKSRKKVKMFMTSCFVNAPLFLHPELLDELLKYVFLPKEVIKAYRELLNENTKKS